MSYDVSVTVDAGGPERISVGESLNMTYNVAPMFRLALGGQGIKDLGECSSAIPRLLTGINAMLSQPETYRALNPANGWGDYEGTLRFLQQLLAQCQAAPEGRVEVW